MKWTMNEDKKWLKAGATALLTAGLLAGCVDDDDDGNTDVDVNTPPPVEVFPDDGVDDTDINVDVDEDTDANIDSNEDEPMNKDQE
ncbi:hypothetical protein ACFPRA_05400 [Sporosarcina soli]|uniref:Lipoprotein n=1 Tax=Sporosarcina soli TaxID=334736 RepID=A0ABW0THR8_9BACL